MAASYHARARGAAVDAPDTTRHFAEAMRLLRHSIGRLGESAGAQPADASIAVAVSLAVHANIVGATREARLHLAGLQRLLARRAGAFAGLCAAAPEVGNKIRRADVELALRTGEPTMFVLGGPTAAALAAPPPPWRSLPRQLQSLAYGLQRSAADALALSGYAGLAQLGAFAYQDMVIRLMQQVLDYAPLRGPRPPYWLDDLWQLGLLAFASTLLHRRREKRAPCAALLFGVFAQQLARWDAAFADADQLRPFAELLLWLAMIYVVAEPFGGASEDGQDTVVRNVLRLQDVLGLSSWDHVLLHLRRFPWVAQFHDDAGYRFWQSIVIVQTTG